MVLVAGFHRHECPLRYECPLIPLGFPFHSPCSTAESFQHNHETPLDHTIFPQFFLISLVEREWKLPVALFYHRGLQRNFVRGLCQPTMASFPLEWQIWRFNLSLDVVREGTCSMSPSKSLLHLNISHASLHLFSPPVRTQFGQGDGESHSLLPGLLNEEPEIRCLSIAPFWHFCLVPWGSASLKFMAWVGEDHIRHMAVNSSLITRQEISQREWCQLCTSVQSLRRMRGKWTLNLEIMRR